MKNRNGIIALATLMLSVTLIVYLPHDSENVSAQQKDEVKIQQKTVRPSARIKGIIKGSEKPDQIPNLIAYELFFRTVAESNARGLVESIGFTDEQVGIVMEQAYSLNSVLENSDKQARELKQLENASTKYQTKKDLARLQTKKDELIAKTVNSYLSEGLNAEVAGRLRSFITTEVKRNMQKIFVADAISKTKEVAFIKSSTLMQSSGGELYLYSAGWNDEANVYGSGSISEQYTSDTSYRASVSVTSPSGRSNSTESDWSYAPVMNDTGLSLGLESGIYSIQANFEEQTGYYDEYGSFYGTGSSSVGSSSDSNLVRPLISITAVNPAEHTFTSTIPTQVFNANIGLSADVSGFSLPVQITVEFNEQNNSGGVTYGVSPNAGTNPPPGRVITISHNLAGETVPAGFNVQPTFNNATGIVVNQFRISRVSRIVNGQPRELDPMTDFQYGARVMNVSFTLPSPSPSASPSQTPVASGPCNPSSLLIGWCYAGGGDYIYPTPPCGCTTAIEKSPILIDTIGNGFAMTNPENGVPFDLLGFGFPLQLSWTAGNSDDAWLALDRNQNNRIDTGKELFGNATQQPDPPEGQERNGFLALARYDKAQNGGNGDGRITRADQVFKKLRLWIDRNHNGISEAEELYRLPALDVVAIRLDYQESDRVDEFGNRFKYRARVRDRLNANVGRWAWDVFLNAEP